MSEKTETLRERLAALAKRTRDDADMLLICEAIGALKAAEKPAGGPALLRLQRSDRVRKFLASVDHHTLDAASLVTLEESLTAFVDAEVAAERERVADIGRASLSSMASIVSVGKR